MERIITSGSGSIQKFGNKYKSITIIILIYILTSCTNETKSISSEIKTQNSIDSADHSDTYDTIIVDKAHVGMTITKLKSIYKGLDFVEEPLFTFGIDSEDNGLVLYKDQKPYFFVWTLEKSDTINGIVILSDQIIIDNDVHVGITAKEFFNKYPKTRLQIDAISNDIEFCAPMNNLNYRVEFSTLDSNRVGEYDITQPEPEFIKLKRLDAIVERIGVYN